MDSRLYPQGKGGLKSKWVSGVLKFYNASGSEVYSIDPTNRTFTIPSGSTFANAGSLSFTGTQAFDDLTVSSYAKFADNALVSFGDKSGNDADVSIKWDGTDLVLLPDVDDTGSFKIGNGTLDFDVRVTLGTAADYVQFDVGNKAVQFAGDARLNFSDVTVAAANTDGGVIKGGTSGAPITEDTANMKFVSFYFDDGATSGEAVGIYDRLYVTGAAGEGIALRAFCSVTDVAAGNARGGHISLSFGATGDVSGLGAALETTLHVPSTGASWTGGTYCSLKVAINSDHANSDPAGATEVSFIRLDNQGDGTGKADVDTDAFIFSFQGFTPGAGSAVDNTSLAELPAGSIAFKVKVGSSTYYIPAVVAAELN